ncbi:MAG: hypothetical protein K6T86_13275 [Pirellulales bacterium]|nr:hypothetical protein [Pirellulales bacterium]
MIAAYRLRWYSVLEGHAPSWPRLALFSPFHPHDPHVINDALSPERSAYLYLIWSLPQLPSEPAPGWLAVSVTVVNRLAATSASDTRGITGVQGFCRWLRQRPPSEMAGTSILIYHITEADIADWHRWRHEAEQHP